MSRGEFGGHDNPSYGAIGRGGGQGFNRQGKFMT